MWHLVFLFYILFSDLCRSRPIADPGLDLEGIDPANNDHQCEYPTDQQLRPWEVNQGICPPSLSHLCRAEVPNSDPEGSPTYIYVSPFFEGDILMNMEERSAMTLAAIDEREQQNAGTKNKTDNGTTLLTEQGKEGGVKSRTTRAIHRFKNMWWKGGKIPYVIDGRFDDDKANMIKKALRHWETMTCIQFKTKTDEDTDYMRFIYQPGCWSYVGRQGGEQFISMGPGCSVFGTIVHEVGHAIGLWHEQSRRDRDKYVKILLENIASGTEDNFNKLPKQNVTSLGYAYDYESIMHYAPNAFSVTGRPTIKTKKIGRPFGFQMGQQKGLSPLDVAQVRGMYKCNKKDAETRKDKCFKSNKGDGREYRGELDYTVDNVTCQYWPSQWPHKHKIYDTENEAINQKKGIGNHNYCRNPSGHKEKPWCFTTLKDVRWQYCNIKICDKKK